MLISKGHTLGHAVTGMFGGGGSSRSNDVAEAPVQREAMQASNVQACESDSKAFMRCLEQNNNEIGSCQIYYNLMKECMASSSNSTSYANY